jgi:GST-like protein
VYSVILCVVVAMTNHYSKGNSLQKLKNAPAKSTKVEMNETAELTHGMAPNAVETLLKPIKLYYWPTPNGWKLTMLLEESGVRYDVVPVNIGAGEQHQDWFMKISPNARMPAIHDPNRGVTIFESGACMIHICQRFPAAFKFCPREKRNDVFQWLFWVNANLGPMAGQFSHFQYYAPAVDSKSDHTYAVERYKNEYDRLIGVIDNRVKRSGGYLAGDFYSIADMSAWPWVKPWKRWMGKSLQDSGYVHAFAWYERIKALPSTERALGVMRKRAREEQAIREGRSVNKEAQKQLFGRNGKSKL